MELATFSTPACAVRSVAEWRAHPARHAQLCLGGAPAFRRRCTTFATFGHSPGSHRTRSWVPSRPPWSDMATFSGPRSMPFSVMFPAFLGHLPRLVPRRSMTLQPCSRSLGLVSTFLGHLSERPPQRLDVSHACLCVLIVCARPVSAAHMFCCARYAAHAALMKLVVGRTHVSHSHVCLSVPPTQCVRSTHLPCMPAMHFLAANKSRHAFSPKAWLCVDLCQLAHRPSPSLRESYKPTPTG
ncbi:hypothetical protein PanWU01x14_070730 [Parasponia andersonii]|uniref:Uncharacterized protein n=1 Tax=Parasponia andersonii TaxID=3476 RepID=A0A2P5DEZ2_PARAD|nr:hypothetical protein PanWU01x14_070730 [Parasponia andersonii]